MDSRFENLVLEEINTSTAVQEFAKQLDELNAKYKDGGVWTSRDRQKATELEGSLDGLSAWIKQEAETFWSEVRQGREFLHKRYITADRRPEPCVITKLEFCRHGELFQVYYRTADGEGAKTKADPMYFRLNSVGGWV